MAQTGHVLARLVSCSGARVGRPARWRWTHLLSSVACLAPYILQSLLLYPHFYCCPTHTRSIAGHSHLYARIDQRQERRQEQQRQKQHQKSILSATSSASRHPPPALPPSAAGGDIEVGPFGPHCIQLALKLPSPAAGPVTVALTERLDVTVGIQGLGLRLHTVALAWFVPGGGGVDEESSVTFSTDGRYSSLNRSHLSRRSGPSRPRSRPFSLLSSASRRDTRPR